MHIAVDLMSKMCNIVSARGNNAHEKYNPQQVPQPSEASSILERSPVEREDLLRTGTVVIDAIMLHQNNLAHARRFRFKFCEA